MEPQTATWLIGRRDVAILPWVCAALVALGLIASILLRGSSSPGSELTLIAAGALCVLGAGSVLTHLTPLGAYLAAQLWPYVAGSIAIGVAIAGGLVADPEIGEVLIAANVVVASYMGLVLPPRHARQGLVVLLTATAAADAVAGTALADAALHFGIPLVGWVIGYLTARAHHRIAMRAHLLSSYDRLTRTLNRRGFAARLTWLLAEHRHHATPISLLVLDLDGFKAVNDSDGHAAGDAILTWVGAQLAELTPADAECGRMGGDEFTIALPNTDRAAASVFARELRSRLGARIGCSIGVATSADPLVTDDDLFRVADAALYACKRDRSLGVQALIAGVARPSTRPTTRVRGSGPLAYAAVRQLQRPPSSRSDDLVSGWLAGRGMLVIGLAGALVVADELRSPGTGVANLLLQYGGVPWVLLVAGLGLAVWNDGHLNERRLATVYYGSGLAIAIGVGVAMLAGGGLSAAIGAALFLKLQFDASVFPLRRAMVTVAMLLPAWAAAAVLGPTSALWAAPFQLTLFGAALALGGLGQRAFSEVSGTLLDLARTDALTGALSRHGFEERAEQLLAKGAANGAPVALLAIDLDQFKAINDTRGHAAGDEVLRQVVLIAKEQLGADAAIGRIGGDEFAVMLSSTSEFEARRAALELQTALDPVIGASIGHAIAPPEHPSLVALQRVADRRSYEAKRGGHQRIVA